MDKIEALGNTLSNITLYDIKSMYTQVRFQMLTRVISQGSGRCTHASDTIGKKCSIQCQRNGG